MDAELLMNTILTAQSTPPFSDSSEPMLIMFAGKGLPSIFIGLLKVSWPRSMAD